MMPNEGKALLTKEGLRDYVRPLDQYSENYLQLLKKELKANERLELIDQLGLSCLGVLLYHVGSIYGLDGGGSQVILEYSTF